MAFKKNPFLKSGKRKRRVKPAAAGKTPVVKPFCPPMMIRYDKHADSKDEYKSVWVCKMCSTCVLSEHGTKDHLERCRVAFKTAHEPDHKAPAESIEDPRYICRICNQFFSRKVTLMKHSEKHQKSSDSELNDSDNEVVVPTKVRKKRNASTSKALKKLKPNASTSYTDGDQIASTSKSYTDGDQIASTSKSYTDGDQIASTSKSYTDGDQIASTSKSYTDGDQIASTSKSYTDHDPIASTSKCDQTASMSKSLKKCKPIASKTKSLRGRKPIASKSTTLAPKSKKKYDNTRDPELGESDNVFVVPSIPIAPKSQNQPAPASRPRNINSLEVSEFNANDANTVDHELC